MQSTLTRSKGLVVTTGSDTLAMMGGTGLRSGAVGDGSGFHFTDASGRACACIRDKSSNSRRAYLSNSRII